MWSGPRNISTALMRSWENRSDTIVWDEPLYAHYLEHTGVAHPGRDETLAAHDRDWRRVVDRLLGPVPAGTSVFYQKQMAHHLLPHINKTWLSHVANCFLIREPVEMLASLVKRFPAATLEDTGLPQQVALWDELVAGGAAQPIVIDARDVLENPRAMLTRLCEALGVPFQEAMLTWPPGPRASDGAWATHWYDGVYASTGFAPYRRQVEPLANRYQPTLAKCNEIYQLLYAQRLLP